MDAIRNMPAVIEVDTPLPAEIPVQAQQMLCLLACGFSMASISRLAGITHQAVWQMCQRWDPDKKFTLTASERRAFVLKLWESRAMEALLHITPDKLEGSSAAELAGIAAKGAKVMAGASPEREKPKDPAMIIEMLGT